MLAVPETRTVMQMANIEIGDLNMLRFAIPCEQQDAHEFVGSWLNQLHTTGFCFRDQITTRMLQDPNGQTDWVKALLKHEENDAPSWVSEAFAVKVKRTIECRCCHDRKVMFDPHMVLAVPVADAPPKAAVSVLDCVRQALMHEFIERRCSHSSCWGQCSEARQTHAITRLSDGLIVTLMRFGRQSESMYHKNTRAVRIEEVLDLASVSDLVGLHAVGSRGTTYELCGICHHSGDLEEGHYWASCKTISDGQWRRFNDSLVQMIDAPIGPSKTAYMLYYSRM